MGTRKPTGCPQVSLKIFQILDPRGLRWVTVHGLIVNSLGFSLGVNTVVKLGSMGSSARDTCDFFQL